MVNLEGLGNYHYKNKKENRRKYLLQLSKRKGKQKVINALNKHSDVAADFGFKGLSNTLYFDKKWLKKH